MLRVTDNTSNYLFLVCIRLYENINNIYIGGNNMLLKFFIDYPYVVYSIISWGFVFLFIRWKGIKRLWPAAILGAVLIFTAFYWLVSVGVYKINITFLSVFGIPFFFILWGAGNGIIFANYIREKAYQRIILILGFAAIIVSFESFVEHFKRVQHLGMFNDVYEFIFDVLILSAFIFLATNFFGKRLRKENS
jgi:hypothetical protein